VSERARSHYDEIGDAYSRYRRRDPRIAALIESSLGNVDSVVDVGSGTGSYEPRGARVVAVEPSWTMIRQRRPGTAPVVCAVAEALPFQAGAFDAALAVLTIHHWSDPEAGLGELARVAPIQVILTWDPAVSRGFWLLADYLPEILELEKDAATLAAVMDALEVVEVTVVPVPADCTDGFLGAYWRRPRTYLDAGAQAAISGFARLDEGVVRRAMERLQRELDDGTWEERYGHLLSEREADLGYRLVRARGRPRAAGYR
jgi:SAM-dependent methyltransferase